MSINIINIAKDIESKGGIVNYIKDEEPVAVSFAVAWAITFLGTLFVGHGWIGSDTWSTVANVVTPIAITAVFYVIGKIARSKVFSSKTVKSLETEIVKLDELVKALAAEKITPAAPKEIPVKIVDSSPVV